MVQSSWNMNVADSRMFQFQSKLKHVRDGLIEWRKKESINARKQIDSINLRMNSMCEEEGQRDWEFWRLLRNQLDVACKEEEEYWSRKSRIEWLQ